VYSGDGDERLRVVYISGWGRSGTTVLDRVLGQLPGFCSVGELRSLWDVDPVRHSCSCGHPVATCPLWAPSLRDALGGATSDEFANMRGLRDRSGRSRDVPARWALSALHKPSGPLTAEYGDRLEALYRQVARRSGAHTIVDSSKHPSEAQLLSQRRGLELYLLHVVRDPRGVAYSWTRSRERHGSGVGAPPQRGALSSTAWWTAWNVAIEWTLAPQLTERYRRVRYEDVMGAPRRELVDIARWLGGDPSALRFSEDDEVLLEPGHLVAGNPNRSGSGPVRLRPDLAWQVELPRSDRWKSTLPALPMLGHYRYPIFS
jgi:Sulfotransferase family